MGAGAVRGTVLPDVYGHKHVPRRHLSPANFETSTKWDKLEIAIREFFESKSILSTFPLSVDAFSVHGIPDDPDLVFDAHCCPIPESSHYIIEFRRVRGDAFKLAKLFFELKTILGIEEDQTLSLNLDLDLGNRSSSGRSSCSSSGSSSCSSSSSSSSSYTNSRGSSVSDLRDQEEVEEGTVPQGDGTSRG